MTLLSATKINYRATFRTIGHNMNNQLGLGLLIMAASLDTQEELDTHSTSESEYVDLSDFVDDLDIVWYQFEPYGSSERRVNLMQL